MTYHKWNYSLTEMVGGLHIGERNGFQVQFKAIERLSMY